MKNGKKKKIIGSKCTIESEQTKERKQDAYLSNESIMRYHRNKVSGQVQNNMHVSRASQSNITINE